MVDNSKDPHNSRHFPGERVYCSTCEKEVPRIDAAVNGWCCLTCEDSVDIYADDGKRKRVLQRRLPEQLESERITIVVMPGKGFDFTHRFLGLTVNGDKTTLRLEGFGPLKRPRFEYVDCVYGAWDENKWPFGEPSM